MADEFPEVVDLNVGGRLFTTSLATLRKDPDSMLAVMFSGRHPLNRDRDGRYFIDCDGDVFAYILEHLRFGTIPSGDIAPRVLKYADYYNIASLKEELQRMLDKQNRYQNVKIRTEPYQTVYNAILERLKDNAENKLNCLPFGVRFYKELHASEYFFDICKHTIMQTGVIWIQYRLTEAQFDHLPMDVCNDISKLGYFVKYLVCACNEQHNTDFRMIIGCCEDQTLDCERKNKSLKEMKLFQGEWNIVT